MELAVFARMVTHLRDAESWGERIILVSGGLVAAVAGSLLSNSHGPAEYGIPIALALFLAVLLVCATAAIGLLQMARTTNSRGSMPALSRGRVFLLGASLGTIASVALIASGSLRVLDPPLWQLVMFFFGFIAGSTFYDCCDGSLPQAWPSEYGYLTAGVIGVSVAYGLFALAVFEIRARRGRNRKADRSASA